MKGGRSDRHTIQAWMVSPESTWLPVAPWEKPMPRQVAERIVCLTEETTETLYCLGEEQPDRRYFLLHGTSSSGQAREATDFQLYQG